ncbi:LPXTG cell wall anchor domain-containing protein [Virgibacillus ainsalahensis]
MNGNKMVAAVTILITGILLSFTLAGNIVHAEEEEKEEIKINILPENVLFDVSNMKPGDWAPRTVVIQNDGMKEFEYVTSLRNDSNSNKLFNELLLEVRDEQGELYDGKLADFDELPPRILDNGTEEELEFTVRFPEHLGNDFQGLDAQFALLFSARGEMEEEEVDLAGVVGSAGPASGNPTGEGSRLPDTASNLFNFLLIGALLLAIGAALVFYNRKRMKNADKPNP